MTALPEGAPTPVVLTVAGSDSSCGAGVQADLKTFSALDVYGVNAVTAIVAESPDAVDSIYATDSTLLGQQLNRVRSAFSISGAKTGMLASRENVEVVIDFFKRNPEIALVVDPVLQATAGAAPLLDQDGKGALRQLFPLAVLLTPNIPEAEELLGLSIKDERQMAQASLDLSNEFGCAVLLKGGHGSKHSSQVIDYLGSRGAVESLVHPRIEVPNLHGTGCTLSAAIAAYLARGFDLANAIREGRAYLYEAMRQHLTLAVESSSLLALNHFPKETKLGPCHYD